MSNFGHYGSGLSGYVHYSQAVSSSTPRGCVSSAGYSPVQQQVLLDLMASGEYETEEDAVEELQRMIAESNRWLYEK